MMAIVHVATMNSTNHHCHGSTKNEIPTGSIMTQRAICQISPCSQEPAQNQDIASPLAMWASQQCRAALVDRTSCRDADHAGPYCGDRTTGTTS
jgi:hypothetical protein